MTQVQWTKVEDAELQRLWLVGISCSAIADKIGGGRNKNSIIGRAKRLGLPVKRKSAPRTKPRKKPAWHNKPSLPPPSRILGPPSVEKGVHILDLEPHHCRAVIGRGPDTFAVYCGNERERKTVRIGGESEWRGAWCEFHRSIYFRSS